MIITKKYKEKVECPKCHKKNRQMITFENEEMCYECFLTVSLQKFKTRKIKIKPKEYKKSNSFSGKEIYAINGITSVYRGGCFN